MTRRDVGKAVALQRKKCFVKPYVLLLSVANRLSSLATS